MFIVPALLVVGGGGWVVANPAVLRGDRRIVDRRFYELEERLGHHVYAPAWLPYGGRVGTHGAMMGRHRILQDFTDRQERSLSILAQERRTPERDRYHEERFVRKAQAKASINGTPGYFVTGSSGERRLFWNTEDMALILSSSVLTDDELVKIAENVR
jgi:hypothetical protein